MCGHLLDDATATAISNFFSRYFGSNDMEQKDLIGYTTPSAWYVCLSFMRT